MSWVQRLGDLVGPTAVDHVSPPGTDAPLPRVSPEGEEAWRAVLRLAQIEGLRCLPTGSGSHLADTDLTGVDLLLSTRREAGIVAYEPGDGTLTARAGTPWTELASAVAAGGHHLSPEFAPDFPGTLGGVIASARSGFERLRYGPLRHQVLGLRFLLADGTAAQSGGRLVKNVTGYDLHRLLAGSKGSMAVILEASLRLAPEPARRRVLTARFDDPGSLLEASGNLRELPLAPEALRVRGEARGGLELSLFLAGRAATVDWEVERARAAVPALVEPPDAVEKRAAAVAAEHARADGTQRLRVTLRPSRLRHGLSEVARRLEAHDLAPRLIAHPWLATLTYDFRADESEALAAFAAEVPDLFAPLKAHHSWSGAPADRPSSGPVDRVRRYGDRLRLALDPDALFAGAGPHAAPPPMPDPVQDTATLVDYAKSLDCIHCGLCLQTCPTFRLTGVESSSPRGRIHLMRAVGEGRLEGNAAYAEELDFCLLCRHCESVCPAGVQFGSMMEFARGQEALEKHRTLGARLARRLGFRHVLPSRMVLRLLGSLLRAAQVTGLDRLAAALLGKRGRGLRDLPRIEPLSLRRLLPRRVPAHVDGPRGGTNQVALLEGCVMPEFYPRVNRSTALSLAKLGVTVEVPPSLVCCGSLHAHNGDPEGARLLAHRMIEAFEESRGEDGSPLPILVNSAGCGAHLRELHHLFAPDDPWHARAADLAERVEDYTEFVARRLAETGTELEAPPLEGSVTWDDPCHLCHAQGVRQPPRDILAALSGLETVELEGSESCCGSAGIYSILRPDDSQAVFAGKLEAFARSGASNLVTANPGCQLQWEAGLRRAGRGERVLHLAELVDAALER